MQETQKGITQKDIQMANRTYYSCSTSSEIQRMQIKATMIYHAHPQGLSSEYDQQFQLLAHTWNWNSDTVLTGINWYYHFEKAGSVTSLQGIQNTKM